MVYYNHIRSVPDSKIDYDDPDYKGYVDPNPEYKPFWKHMNVAHCRQLLEVIDRMPKSDFYCDSTNPKERGTVGKVISRVCEDDYFIQNGLSLTPGKTLPTFKHYYDTIALSHFFQIPEDVACYMFYSGSYWDKYIYEITKQAVRNRFYNFAVHGSLSDKIIK
jgi:hypothetical protein